jgi:hypothetical protein
MRTISLALWALCAALLAGCELLGRVANGRYGTLGRLLGLLTSTTWSTLAVFLGWMWLGWHLFAR